LQKNRHDRFLGQVQAMPERCERFGAEMRVCCLVPYRIHLVHVCRKQGSALNEVTGDKTI